MNLFKRWNNIVGWAVFAAAAVVYLLTIEPVSSLWDCSEFIATSYKLEVGHPPGAPLFMMLARLATLFSFGNPDYVGRPGNAMNAIVSAFCILFLFWTITHLARRLVTRDGRELTVPATWAVLAAGAGRSPTPSPIPSGSRPSKARSTPSRRCSPHWSCGSCSSGRRRPTSPALRAGSC